jgi:hypothetical protein
MTATDTMAMRPLLFPGDQQFWYETLRALGHTAYGGADIGEVITTAQRITANDYGSWYEQWAATAQRTEAEARAQLAAGSAPTTGCCAPPLTTAARSSSPATATPTRAGAPSTRPASAASPAPPR